MSQGTACGDGIGIVVQPVGRRRGRRTPSRCWPTPTRTRRGSREKPCAPGLASAVVPQSVAANRPVGPRIRIGWTSRASIASFISRAPTFLPEVLGRAADHQAGEEDADDQVQQQVDHADALAAEDAVEPHADHRREAGQRIEAVHCVDRAAGDVGRDRREGRAGRGAEAQFLAFEIAEMLIDRQRGDGRARHVELAVRRRGAGDLIGRRRHARSGPGSAPSCRSTMTQTMSPAIIASITP